MSRRRIVVFSILTVLFSLSFGMSGRAQAHIQAGSEARAETPLLSFLGVDATDDEVNISGQWKSNIGAVYEIQQTGSQFTWSAPSLNQSGTGTISGNNITLSGPGWTVKGTITELDVSGNAAKIVGENGVILFRSADALPQPPQPSTPSQPAAPPGGAVSLTGKWNSNDGEAYEIQQSGNQFTWSAPSLDQSGPGTISGNAITISGPGWTVKGTITEADASGNATKIECENGVLLYRTPGMPGVQPAPAPPAVPQSSPQQSAIPDISGKWKNNLGVVYEIKQDGEQFVWKVLLGLETAAGKITGTTVSATWTGAVGSGSSKGQLLFDGSTGKVAAIKWDNGTTFNRQ
jgi:hypothetical protein